MTATAPNERYAKAMRQSPTASDAIDFWAKALTNREQLPTARELVEIGFAMAERVLAAQKDFALALIEAGSRAADEAGSRASDLESSSLEKNSSN
jgi:hypothetical protein